MLKIGDFSKLSRVSVRMLRYYDEIGLLKPAEIDRFTDYRYYSEAQLPTVCRITALRDMGFGLADICAILPIYDDRERLDDFLAARQAELEQQRDDVAQRLRLLDTARKRLRKEETMNYDVTIKTLPERYAATVRMTIPRYQDEGMVWHVLCRETDSMHLLPTDPCYCCVVFLDGEYKEKDVTVEAQKTVRARIPTPSTFGSARFRPSPMPAAPSRAATSRSMTSPPCSPRGSRRTAMNTPDRCSTFTTSARTRRRTRASSSPRSAIP